MTNARCSNTWRLAPGILKSEQPFIKSRRSSLKLRDSTIAIRPLRDMSKIDICSFVAGQSSCDVTRPSFDNGQHRYVLLHGCGSTGYYGKLQNKQGRYHLASRCLRLRKIADMLSGRVFKSFHSFLIMHMVIPKSFLASIHL